MDEIKGRFRSKKNYFSQVSNTALRDKNLSLKAKGLYSLIQSFITIENFVLYKSTLIKECKEKETSFNGAWKELKDNGYLIQYKQKDEISGKWIYEYELLDDSIKKPDVDFPGVENPHVENPPYGFSTCGKYGVYNNTDLNNTYLNNTNNNNNIYIEFEKFIKKNYLGKKSKSIRDKKVPKLLKKYGEEILKQTLLNYKNECIGKEIQFILNESTFWNTRYIDYLPENYEQNPYKLKEGDYNGSTTKPNKHSKQKEGPQYDFSCFEK